MSRLSSLSGSGGVISVPASVTNTNPLVPALTINPAPGQVTALLLVNGDIQTPGNVNAGTNLVAAGNVNAGLDVQLYGNSPATPITNVTFGSVILQGNYWDGAASQVTAWKLTQALGTGTTPTDTLTLSRTGSPSSPGVRTFNFGGDYGIQYNGIPAAKVYEKTVTMSAANLLAIGATPFQLLPAPGANKAYQIISAYAHYRFVTTAYTLGGMTALVLLTPGANAQTQVAVAGFLNQAADRYQRSAPAGFAVGLSSPAPIANQPLNVLGDASPTLGDGTLTWTIEYTIFDVTATS